MPRLLIVIFLLLPIVANPVAARESLVPRTTATLDGQWDFRRDGGAGDAWKSVPVPSVFQEHEGQDWHGVGWYRKSVSPAVPQAGRRLLLQFDAAATHAEVWWNDVRLGEHLGGWTPFRFDVTELVRKKNAGPHEIRLRLDEKVGHNTQGFLPIIQPHFGGLWLSAKLIEVPDSYVDELTLQAYGDPGTRSLTINGRCSGTVPKGTATVRVRRERGSWSPAIAIVPSSATARFTAQVPVDKPEVWSPANPAIYEMELSWGADRVVTKAAFRTFETDGPRLLLNGQPLNVRGVLNWGYYPPRLAPMPDSDRWLRDIRLAKSMGFNLMKFCLWIPPREFLDLCDREGMLVWQEYPTWHPKFDPAHKAELIREYTEFFSHDRNHPSVILRSLTCETGSSADLGVVRDLYDLAKSCVPGCVVEDDSSWIEWNRISDFFDDHPYGNNHTWKSTLHRLRAYAQKHGPKPMLLGEAIAADTWVDPEPLLKKVGNERPYWLPGFLDGNKRWLDRMKSIYGPGGLDRLESDSKRYAMLMRKFQIEMFRREVPDGGYVVSVLRDFSLAGMGLLDFNDQPKWSADEWAWHADPSQAGADGPPIPRPSKTTADVITARRLDEPLLAKLEAGAKVLLLPDGEKGSFPLRDHWFLRGGPYLPDHPIWEKLPRDFMVRYQHLAMGGRVIPDIRYFDEIDPVVLLWDNHDIKEVRTHGLVFETRVGKGRLFVSALDHSIDNELGRSVLSTFTKHVAEGPPPKRALKPDTIARMRARLRERMIDLTRETWRFKPDPRNVGINENWQKLDLPLDDSWSRIRVGKHWEGQGWPRLDGWAWYRLDLTIPGDWAGATYYLSFEGVDDHFQAFVNGAKIGEGGDPVQRRTAFDEKSSHKISHIAKAGARCTIVVRVLDWYGAGGIHRPVTVGTTPHGNEIDWLK